MKNKLSFINIDKPKHYLWAIILGSLSLVSQPKLEAIVINDTAGADTAKSLGANQTAVVELNMDGYLSSGVLIDENHILTARHSTRYGNNADINHTDMTVYFHSDNDGAEDLTRYVTNVSLIDNGISILGGNDLAILRLNESVTTFDSMAILENPSIDLVGRTVGMVGFGHNGLGDAGHGNTADGLRWGAENVIDAYGLSGVSGGFFGVGSNIFSADFDDGTSEKNSLNGLSISSDDTPLANEGITAGGDSGGPLIFRYEDISYVAGILAGGSNTGLYGDVSWWTGVYEHRGWIKSIATGASFVEVDFSVPDDASTLLLMMTGMISLFGGRRYFR